MPLTIYERFASFPHRKNGGLRVCTFAKLCLLCKYFTKKRKKYSDISVK